MPMTTWVGRKPAISSASWRATAQLSTTAPMSATVPDCMWARPWRLRPTPRTVPWPRSSMSKTSALANSVPMSRAVQAAQLLAAVALPEPPQEGHAGSACPTRRRTWRRAPRGSPPARREARPAGSPFPWAISGRPPPLPSRAAMAARTRSPAEIPRATRSSETVDEELRLVGVEREGDHARAEDRPDVLRGALDGVDRLPRPRPARRGGRPARPPRRRAARSARLRHAAAALAQAALRLAELGLERGDPVEHGRRPTGRPDGRRPRRASSARSRRWASAPSPVRASIRRMPEPMLRSPVITKLPICPEARQWVPPHSSKL